MQGGIRTNNDKGLMIKFAWSRMLNCWKRGAALPVREHARYKKKYLQYDRISNLVSLISLHMNLLVRPRSSDGQSDEPVKVIDYYLYNI